MLTEKRGARVEILTPKRGPKRAFLELVEKNAEHSFEARFRVRKPAARAVIEALQEALGIPEPPRRIECFDISHIQGTDQVASMVVWEDGKMKKSDYRKFIIKTVAGNDDFASMREVVTRRYQRLQEEKQPFPGLILIDGGIGQLHAAADALESLGVINQPLASLAKKEEILYVLGQESEPIRLDRHSPVLHLVQTVRDEAHRFAVTFHRQNGAQPNAPNRSSNAPRSSALDHHVRGSGAGRSYHAFAMDSPRAAEAHRRASAHRVLRMAGAGTNESSGGVDCPALSPEDG